MDRADAIEETFLWGTQVMDGEGLVELGTVYPGWYPGRTAHIHSDRITSLTPGTFQRTRAVMNYPGRQIRFKYVCDSCPLSLDAGLQ